MRIYSNAADLERRDKFNLMTEGQSTGLTVPHSPLVSSPCRSLAAVGCIDFGEFAQIIRCGFHRIME